MSPDTAVCRLGLGGMLLESDQYDENVYISFARRWHAEQHVNIALLALLFYEYCITLRREVVTMWGRKFRAATWLFLLNRYLTITYALLLTAADQARGHNSCLVNTRLFQTFSRMVTVVFALFSSLRIYAIWNRSTYVFALIFVINIAPIGTNIYIHVKETVDYEVFPWGCVCITRSLISTKVHVDLVRVTRVAVMFGDAVVLLLTWWKTMSIRKEASLARIKVKLTTLLIRDGTLFFVTLLAFNLLRAVLIETTEVPGYMMAPVNVITSILISRFMLDLREIGHDVRDPMDIPFITALAMREGGVGEYCRSADTLDTANPTRSRPRYDYEDAEAGSEVDKLDVPVLKAESSEAPDTESEYGIAEVQRAGLASSRIILN
ncbi:hypothetical protein BDY19DRAFT_907474 [Irpex rosettiformis]|uniref:Uncharacterized protein n=1 Tax=Irpex rosettiformis TaxID=378272 RepID=A0ACB8TZE0_9APHY|nr:hypothetical protein BDY19DRAFT_907474 [Irpex rosettiformis]